MAILANRDAIAIDQDKAGHQATRAGQSGDQEIWLRNLNGGDHAVAVFNRGAVPATVTVHWADLKIAAPTRARDLWAHRDEQFAGAEHTVTVPSHGVVVWRVRQ